MPAGFEGCISDVLLDGAVLPLSGETDQFTIETTGGVEPSCPEVRNSLVSQLARERECIGASAMYLQQSSNGLYPSIVPHLPRLPQKGATLTANAIHICVQALPSGTDVCTRTRGEIVSRLDLLNLVQANQQHYYWFEVWGNFRHCEKQQLYVS